MTRNHIPSVAVAWKHGYTALMILTSLLAGSIPVKFAKKVTPSFGLTYPSLSLPSFLSWGVSNISQNGGLPTPR